MSLLTGSLNQLFSQDSMKISEALQRIGYFDLVNDQVKLNYVKQQIDKNYYEGHIYSEKKWLILPSDSYISSVYGLKEYGNKSSISDFRAFQVWAGDMYEQNLPSYLNSAKVVFERSGFNLNWENEKIDWKKESSLVENIHHTVVINNKEYLIYSGNVKDRSTHPAYVYLVNFRKVLNQVLKDQNSKSKIILLSAPESVYFILMDERLIADFKKVIANANNKLEE
jgi:hypothetical protein